MRINLLPGNKKDDDKKDSANVRVVPMSTPVPLDKSVVSEPVELAGEVKSDELKQVNALPVARKYTTIDTRDIDSENTSVSPQRDQDAPKFVRDRVGSKEPRVFAPRPPVHLSDPIEPRQKVKVDQMLHAEKKTEPDLMLENKPKDLKPSAKENFLEKKFVDVDKKEIKPNTPKPKEIEVPKIEKVKNTQEKPDERKHEPEAKVRRHYASPVWPQLVLLLVAGLVSGVALWWGILYWHDESVNAQIRRAEILQEDFTNLNSLEDAGVKMQTQLRVLDDWLNNLPNYENIYTLLEDTVLENVSYIEVEVNEMGQLNITGLAPNSIVVAQQYQIFSEREDLSFVRIESTEVQNDSTVKFMLTLKLDE